MSRVYETSGSGDRTRCILGGTPGTLFSGSVYSALTGKKIHNIRSILAEIRVRYLRTWGDSCAILTISYRIILLLFIPEKTVTRAIYRHCITVSRGILS